MLSFARLVDRSTHRLGTRERLLETARELFHAQGYAATGLAQILKEAGVRSGSLYHFFESKEDLLLGVLDYYKALLEPRIVGPAFAKAADPVGRVFAVLDQYREQLRRTKFALGCPIGALALELNEMHPDAQARIGENFEGWRRAVRGCLEAARGRLRAGTDLDDLASFVLVTMEGAVMLSRTHRSMRPFDAAVRHLRAYFGLLMKGGTDEDRADVRRRARRGSGSRKG
jgi:TetR/AcrR family transcriptional regulator, transcriptional repressor for nem operon